MDKEKKGLLSDYDDATTPRRPYNHNKTFSTPGSIQASGKRKVAYVEKTPKERDQPYRYTRRDRGPAPGSEDETEGDFIDLKRSFRRFGSPAKRRFPRLAESLDQEPSFSVGFYKGEEEPSTDDTDDHHTDHEDFDCLVSRTTLLLPFKWSSPLNADIKNWVRHLLERKIVSAKDEEIYLWKTTDKLPFEAGDLDPSFRRLVGWKDESWDAPEFKVVNIMEDYFESVKMKQKEKPRVKLERTRSHGSGLMGGINTTKGDVLLQEPEWDEQEDDGDDAITDTCQRLELTPEARNLLFSHTKLCAIHHEDSPVGVAQSTNNTNTDSKNTDSKNTDSKNTDSKNTDSKRSSSDEEQEANTNARTAPNPNGFNIAQPPSAKKAPSTRSDSSTEHDDNVSCHIEVANVDIWVFPLGTAILMFHINWLHNGQKMTVDELRTWLFLSKFTYKVPGVFSGWSLHNEAWSNLEYSDAHYRSLGRKLIGSIYEGRMLSLRALGNWLLCGRREDPEDPPKRLSRYQKRAYHHSVVVIDREPKQEQINEYLFHLRRAYGQRNRPQSLFEQGVIDRVLIQRQNRYLALSRVGTVSLSWPSEYSNKFEVEQWHKKFLGIYLMLALHVHGEKSVLLELSNLSAASGQLLRQVTHASLQEMSRYRKQLIELATLMTRYTLQMSSDDCGGLSEYVEFFTAMRDIFSIKSQRSELREEIQEVMALVESNYLEEQRKLRNIERNHRDREDQRRKLTEQAHLIHQARFERMIAAVSSFTLPVVIVSGLFGMNNEDLPVNWSFWPLIGVTLCLSFVMLFLVLCLSRQVKPTELELMKSERERK